MKSDTERQIHRKRNANGFFKKFLLVDFSNTYKVEKLYNELPCTYHLVSTIINMAHLFLLYTLVH